MRTRTKIVKIINLLNKACGTPAPLKKDDPVDVLVRTVLSQNTTDKNSLKAFAVLKLKFKSWDELLNTDTRKIARLIRHAGLANIKAKRIKEILGEIEKRGQVPGSRVQKKKISLGFLAKMDVEDSLEYLKSLKGVGPKTAACVMLFAFNKPVMPVDTHIFRVTKRLGLIGEDLSIEEAHKRLLDAVPKHLIYQFHLGIIEHGRKTCIAQNPRCGVCILYGLCRFKDKQLYKRKAKSVKRKAVVSLGSGR